MFRMLARLAAVLLVASSPLAPPALADFSISKPKAKPQVRQQPSQRSRSTRPRTADDHPVAEPSAAPVTGINPGLMQEAVTEAKFSATLARDAVAHTAILQVSDPKGGWSVNFSECGEDLCGSMEFYALWRTPNEANVCKVWGNDVAKDPTRELGKPFCYTVPALPRQLHLKLSSQQAPYAALPSLTGAEAKARMQAMIETWTTYMAMLPQAWRIASGKCPRAADKCG